MRISSKIYQGFQRETGMEVFAHECDCSVKKTLRTISLFKQKHLIQTQQAEIFDCGISRGSFSVYFSFIKISKHFAGGILYSCPCKFAKCMNVGSCKDKSRGHKLSANCDRLSMGNYPYYQTTYLKTIQRIKTHSFMLGHQVSTSSVAPA